MQKLNEVDKNKKSVKKFVIGGLIVSLLLIVGIVWQLGIFSKQPIVPLEIEETLNTADVVVEEIPVEVNVMPIVVPTPVPEVPVGDEDGIPVTGLIGETEENVVENPETAAEDMVKAVEKVLEDSGIDLSEATDEEVEEAVEQVNNQNNNANTDGNRKFVDGKEYIKHPLTGEWVEKGPPGDGGTAPPLSGESVGY